MRLNEVSYTDAKPIDGYGPGFFRVGGAVIEGAVLVLPIVNRTRSCARPVPRPI